ncbi:hypothetical protein [Trinickia sp.]|uniref:hypothetical protein n=1 Tax=Trinickia sp. TaxID=2571163 RepID=UPI003F813D31
MVMMYWMSAAPRACEGFEPVGRVFDSGRGILLPGIARLTERVNKVAAHAEISRTRYVKPGMTIQVKGLSGSEEPQVGDYSCGPIVTALTPEKGHSYLVDFDYQGTRSCSQRITDVTDPGDPIRVGQAVTCKRPLRIADLRRGDENFLKSFHEQVLDDSRKKEEATQSDSEKAFAMQHEASALDSLGRSDEALTKIDQALKLIEPSKSKDLIATKAGILFSLNRPEAALMLLTPELEKTRTFADSKAPAERASALATYTEGFMTATFAHMQLQQWQDAIGTLADAESPLEGPSFYAYRGLVYRYIMSRAHDPSLANPRLEHDATYYAEHDRTHYGALLRMWQGTETATQASTEMDAVIGGLSGTDRQDARAEELFYTAAYAKFVDGHPDVARSGLKDLDHLAPYGSVEWIYGRRVLD